MKNNILAAIFCGALATTAGAVTTFTETFDTGANGWLNGASGAPTYESTGGVGNSPYLSYTSTFTSGASGSFGAPPLQLLMRANSANDASGDAFVGNWIADGVQSFTLTLRHNYSSSLDFYVRIAGAGGAGASLATGYSVPSNTWTTISFPISDGNPPFLSYGASDFNGVFTNVQNLQLGLYVPASTTFTDLKMDIDNVGITVPEPSSCVLLGLGSLALLRRRR